MNSGPEIRRRRLSTRAVVVLTAVLSACSYSATDDDNGFGGGKADDPTGVVPDLAEISELLWCVDVGTHARTPAVAEDGTIYLIDQNPDGRGMLHAFDASGERSWSSPLSPGGFGVVPPVVRGDGTIVVGSSSAAGSWAGVEAFSPSGERLWSFAIESDLLRQYGAGEVTSVAIASDGGVVFTYRGSAVALSADGEKKWLAGLSGHGRVRSVVLDSEDRSFVVTYREDLKRSVLFALDYGSGVRLWSEYLPGLGSSPAIAADGSLIVLETNGSSFNSSDERAFSARDPASGGTLWRDENRGRVRRVDTDLPFYIGRDGAMYPPYGSDGDTYSGLVDSGEMLSADLIAEAVEPGLSSLRVSEPALGGAGSVYVRVRGWLSTSEPGRLCALRGDFGGAADAPWPLYRQSSARTARSSLTPCTGSCPAEEAVCIGSNTLMVPQAGFCTMDGDCAYPSSTPVECEAGCEAGACRTFCIDEDDDGYGVGDSCDGPDCDDADADIHAGCWKEEVFPKPWPATAEVSGTLRREEHSCALTTTSGGLCRPVAPTVNPNPCDTEVTEVPSTLRLHIDADGQVTADALPVSVCMDTPDPSRPTEISVGSFSTELFVDPFWDCMEGPLRLWGGLSIIGESALELRETCNVDYTYVNNGGNTVVAGGVFEWTFDADL